jgi:uncharacterized protein (DUF2141 family)
MKKIIISTIVVLFVTGSLGFAEETFVVSGDLVYATEADIYISLFNQQTFADWRNALPPGHYTQKMKADSSGKTSFSFTNVPAGEYLIIAFVDVNNNGILDRTTWGFVEEPTLFYMPNPIPGAGTNWHDQRFEVVTNVSGIILK